MSSSNFTQNQENSSRFESQNPTEISMVDPGLASTAPQELLESAVANLWAAVKLAEAHLTESARLLEEELTMENIEIVVMVQKGLVEELRELRYAMKVDFKHAGAQSLLQRGMNPGYEPARR
ncbi:hypothetical protein MMC11_003262 [Xylographa trunciseda]|nr:hypothetical protein [Xylographa trunciseda]